jgi:hypothetical protein
MRGMRRLWMREFFLCDADRAPDTTVANCLPFELARYRFEERCMIRWR